MASNERAYALKESLKDSFAGGSVAYGDGQTLNVGELLKAGHGYIVTSDENEIAALDGYDGLKAASVSDARSARPTTRQKKES